jgi:hypothetical protein
MRRIALVAAVMPLVIAAPARAALPPAHPPAKKVAGVRVAWPPLTTVTPGTIVGVKVSSSRRRSQLALLRVDAAGRPMYALVRDTLLSGTFSVTIPPGPAGARYQLRLTVGGKRYWSWLTTPATVAAVPAAPIVIPAPAPEPQNCTEGPAAGQLRLSTTTVAPGGILAYELVNSGDACVWVGPGWRFERQLADGTWEGVPGDRVFPTIVERLRPGAAYAEQAVAPSEPGTYRLLDSMIGEGGALRLAVPFTVTG